MAVISFELVPGTICAGGGHGTFAYLADDVEQIQVRIDVPAGADAEWGDELANEHWARFIAAGNYRTAQALATALENQTADDSGLRDRR